MLALIGIFKLPPVPRLRGDAVDLLLIEVDLAEWLAGIGNVP
jgi:hypothetical protein